MAFNEVNLMIEDFYKLFYETEELILKQGIKCLTTTELHVIEAIGNDSLTMNELSDRLGITMGTATVAINKLTDKGFIKRERSHHDRRKVFVSLSKKGEEALKYHDNFHKTIISKMTENLTDEELNEFTGIFGKILNNLENQLEYIRPDIINNFSKNSLIKITEIKGSKVIKDFFKGQNILVQTTIKILDKTNYNIIISVEDTKLELDLMDSKNLVGVQIKQ